MLISVRNVVTYQYRYMYLLEIPNVPAPVPVLANIPVPAKLLSFVASKLRSFEPVFFTSALELAMGRNMLDSEGGKLDT